MRCNNRRGRSQSRNTRSLNRIVWVFTGEFFYATTNYGDRFKIYIDHGENIIQGCKTKVYEFDPKAKVTEIKFVNPCGGILNANKNRITHVPAGVDLITAVKRRHNIYVRSLRTVIDRANIITRDVYGEYPGKKHLVKPPPRTRCPACIRKEIGQLNHMKGPYGCLSGTTVV